jgi:hypothetical protein
MVAPFMYTTRVTVGAVLRVTVHIRVSDGGGPADYLFTSSEPVGTIQTNACASIIVHFQARYQ